MASTSAETCRQAGYMSLKAARTFVAGQTYARTHAHNTYTHTQRCLGPGAAFIPVDKRRDKHQPASKSTPHKHVAAPGEAGECSCKPMSGAGVQTHSKVARKPAARWRASTQQGGMQARGKVACKRGGVQARDKVACKHAARWHASTQQGGMQARDKVACKRATRWHASARQGGMQARSKVACKRATRWHASARQGGMQARDKVACKRGGVQARWRASARQGGMQARVHGLPMAWLQPPQLHVVHTQGCRANAWGHTHKGSDASERFWAAPAPGAHGQAGLQAEARHRTHGPRALLLPFPVVVPPKDGC